MTRSAGRKHRRVEHDPADVGGEDEVGARAVGGGDGPREDEGDERRYIELRLARGDAVDREHAAERLDERVGDAEDQGHDVVPGVRDEQEQDDADEERLVPVAQHGDGTLGHRSGGEPDDPLGHRHDRRHHQDGEEGHGGG